MGIDYGTARIGVALSDELQMLAHPAETIAVAKTADPPARIARDRAGEKCRTDHRRSSPAHERKRRRIGGQAREFAEKLRAKVTCEVRTWDERLSTVAAHRSLREAGKSTRQTRGYIDQVAAQILLQSYLDSLEFNQVGTEPNPFA